MYVVGLGNPGDGYETTRHNAGFMVIDAMTSGMRSKRRCRGVFYGPKGKLSGFFKPMTYMNLSGKAVRCLSEELEISPHLMVVCHDDMDIPFGEIRVKTGGGSGGHKGIESIVSELGTNAFARVRVGVSKPGPKQDPADYVLQPFTDTEKNELDKVLKRAVSAVHTICTRGISAAQTEYNRRIKKETEETKENLGGSNGTEEI